MRAFVTHSLHDLSAKNGNSRKKANCTHQLLMREEHLVTACEKLVRHHEELLRVGEEMLACTREVAVAADSSRDLSRFGFLVVVGGGAGVLILE